MAGVKDIVKSVVRPVLVTRARGKVRELGAVPGETVGQLAVALDKTFENKTTPDEREWIVRIERLRDELNTSRLSLELTDFGAGDPHKDPSSDQMDQGRLVTTTVGDLSRSSSKQPLWAFLLFRLIREFKPEKCIELGTCLGVSAAYQAAALAMNGRGDLVTIEGADVLADMSSKHLQSLALSNVKVVPGRFQDALERVLEMYRPIDYAFIDGHHDEQATIDYFEQILQYVADPCIFVFDDISWSPGMHRAWEKITSSPSIPVAINLRAVGVALLDTQLREKHHVSIPMV